MDRLALKLLGDLAVVRDGRTQSLPPSKKTRGLLAYLALHDRAFGREQLCELLWEIPDDPRGSLRWSLSKLRRLVDDDDRQRIVADRQHVSLDITDLTVDVMELHRVAARPEAAALEALEHAADACQGNFLEGLELFNLHDFHAWCVAERERAAQSQAIVLRSLVDRLAGEPERALRHARALVTISPYDESARAALIRLLRSLRHDDEAEQHYLLGTRMLKEAGDPSSGALYAAWRRDVVAAQSPGLRADPPSRNLEGPATGTVTPAGSLIGRDAQAQRLADTFDTVASQGEAAFLLVCGEPGMGKSRLAAAITALARGRGAVILESSAFESEGMRPFALWIDALRRHDPERATVVFDEASHGDRERLFDALSDLVAGYTAEDPVMLVFDDVHWCDASSAAALHYVARMNRDRPLFGVLAARDGELHDNGAVQQVLNGMRREGLLSDLPLPPMSRAGIKELIRDRAPGADAERLAGQCAGNPLLALELARAEVAGDGAGSLRELIRERLARFDVDGGEVLRWAAVLAPNIDVDALVRVTGLDADRVAQGLELAERQAMLIPSDRGFRFAHDLVARGVYAEIAPARRRVMHHRLAVMLEQATAQDLDHAAGLAHHASQSGDPGLAARAMLSAGRLCLRFFANDRAQSLARAGLQLAGQRPDQERVCLAIELHDVLMSAAPLEDWQAAADQYAALAEQALDHGAIAHARLGYQMASLVRWQHGQWASAREESLQAERVTRGSSDREHIIGMAETARCLALLERDLSQADAMLMEADALARRKEISHPAIPMAQGMLCLHQNALDEAEEHFQHGRTLYKSAGDRIGEYQANEYLTMIAVVRRQYEVAARRCEALASIGERIREGSEAPFARAMTGLCHYALTDQADQLDDALDALRIADAKQRLAYVQDHAALLDNERGRHRAAIARAEEALAAASVLERATEMVLAHLALAVAHDALGDRPASRAHWTAIATFDQAPVAQWARALCATLSTPPAESRPG